MSGSWWFEIGLITAIVVGTLGVMLAAAYDLHQAWTVRRRGSSRARRPHVTIIVVIYQTADNLVTCLNSIRRLHYRHYDIVVVVDSRATRNTKRATRAITSSGRVYIARKPAPLTRLVRSAYQRSQRGEFVLALDSSQAITARSLTQAITLLSESKKATGLVMSPALQPILTLRAAVESMRKLSWKLATKAISITGLYQSRTICLGRLYRREGITSADRHLLVYDSKTEIAGKTSSSGLVIKLSSYVAAAGFIGVAGYSCILAAHLQTTEPLSLSWSVVIIWICITIWLDDEMRFWQKVGLVLVLPISYFAIVATIIVGSVEKIVRRQTIF